MPAVIDANDSSFLEKRRKLARWWNIVGPLMFAGLATFVAWMFWTVPRLVNPLNVVSELDGGRIPQATLELMAVMLPIVDLALFLVLAAMLAFTFTMIGNDRRYLRIIDRLKQQLESHQGDEGGKST